MSNNKNVESLSILNMPEWKSKVLNAVAWLLGMRGEHVACITFNFDYRDPKTFLQKLDDMNDVCLDCDSDSCRVCTPNK